VVRTAWWISFAVQHDVITAPVCEWYRVALDREGNPPSVRTTSVSPNHLMV